MFTFIILLLLNTPTGVQVEVYEYKVQSDSFSTAYDSCVDAVEMHVFDTMDHSSDARIVAGMCFEKEEM